MAQLGVDAIAKFAEGGAKPTVTPGWTSSTPGSQLVTDKPVSGCDSITVGRRSKICWGAK